jgi:hypothetical protein
MFSRPDRPWLDSLTSALRGGSGRPRKANRRRHRPAVEALEERTVLSTVFVNAANVGDPLQDGSAAHPFGTIQQGVNAANPSDTVSVAAGTYTEAVSVGKPLDLEGTAGKPAGVVIDPPAGADGLAITASSSVTVSDLRVAPSAGRGHNGVTATGSSWVSLNDVELENSPGFGLEATNVDSLSLDGITLLDNAQGGGEVTARYVGVAADPFPYLFSPGPPSLVPYSATLTPGFFQDTRAGVTRQGITYTNVSELQVSGTGNDSFAVTPSPDTAFDVFSAWPAQGRLDLNLAGVTNPTVTPAPEPFYGPRNENSGVSVGTWSFGNRQPVGYSGIAHLTPGMEVSGQVFDDLNVNGARDAGEPTLAGYTVLLTAVYGGLPVETAVTDSAGSYALTNLVPVDYRVTVAYPPGQVGTSPAGGAYVIGAPGGPPSALAVSGQDFGIITNTNRAFVYQAHRDLLQQPIDSASLTAWQAKLDEGKVSRAQVAASFICAQQYRLVTARGLYQDYLGRAGTARELNTLARLQEAADGPQRAQARLLGSGEYFRANGRTTASWLAAAYRDATGLDLSPAARRRYRGLLAQGVSREGVALLMLTSPAGRVALLQGWSNQYLHRLLRSTELASYRRLFAQAWSEDQVLARIIGSRAYLA